MTVYLQPRGILAALLATGLALPNGSAQELPGAPSTLPEPPRASAPTLVDIGTDEPPFDYITIGFQSCKLPCRMYLVPGLQPVIASGRRSLVSHVEVTPNAARINFVDVTGAYRTAGAVLIPTGIIAASSLWALGLACRSNSSCTVANFVAWPLLGFTAMMTGIGLLGYSAGRDRYRLRAVTALPPVSSRLRLTGVAAAPTTAGAAMGASFEF